MMSSPPDQSLVKLKVHGANNQFFNLFTIGVRGMGVMEHYNTMDDKDKARVTGVLDTLTMYDYSGQALYLANDIGILFKKKRIATSIRDYDETEKVSCDYIDLHGEPAHDVFLTNDGLIKFIYKADGALARIYQKVFTRIIKQVLDDPDKFSQIFAGVVRRNPELAQDAMSEFNEAVKELNALYQMQKERTKSLEAEVEAIAHERNEAYSTAVDMEMRLNMMRIRMGELSTEHNDEEMIHMLKKAYMKKYLVIALKRELVKKVKPDLRIAASYDDDLQFFSEYGPNGGAPIVFYLTTKVPKVMKGLVIIDKVYLTSADHQRRIYGVIKDDPTAELIEPNKTHTYVYCYYDLFQSALQNTTFAMLKARHEQRKLEDDTKDVAAAEVD